MSIAGFRFAAVAAGIKKKGGLDLALAVADAPAVAAGVFTRNIVRAAPVELAIERIRSGRATALLVNSGCANACTGEPGMEAARKSTSAVARALGIDPSGVLPASTGVIGELLPVSRVESHASELVAGLAPENAERFAEAICTTDRWTKIARARVGAASLLGIAKGAGMIHPDLGLPHATMLAFVFTDALIEVDVLGRVLAEASERTFNAATVDGDTSTNDTLVALASGASGERPSEDALLAGMVEVCGKLAFEMVADGEGAEHVARIRVRGCLSQVEARTVARTVATSLLVKTALNGCDANWGRLLAAAGRSGVAFDPRRAVISIGDVPVVRDGMAVGGDADQRATAVLKQRTYTIELVLGEGPGTFEYLTSDLGHGYVDVNASYRS